MFSVFSVGYVCFCGHFAGGITNKMDYCCHFKYHLHSYFFVSIIFLVGYLKLLKSDIPKLKYVINT